MPRPANVRLILEFDYEGQRFHMVADHPGRNGPDVVVFNSDLKDRIAECIGANSHGTVRGDGGNWPAERNLRMGRPRKGAYNGAPAQEDASGGQTRALDGGDDPPICWHEVTCDWLCVD